MFAALRNNLLLVLTVQLAVIGAAFIAAPRPAAAAPAALYATQVDTGHLPQVNADQGNIKLILNLAFDIIGSLAVLMIVISGVKYITSSGDAQKVSEAKSGIMYALIGLIIAILSQAIVAYVVNKASP
jgi:hypothetical protein